MIGPTNAVIGGGNFTKSVILVTAPTGSTVTCRKGSTVKKAEEKNGTWIFGGLEAGEWMLVATSGNHSASKSLNVDGVQAYSVTLNYGLYIVENGVLNEEIFGKASNPKWGDNYGGTTYLPNIHQLADAYKLEKTDTSSDLYSWSWCSGNKIDCRGYSTLNISYDAAIKANSYPTSDGGDARAILKLGVNTSQTNLASLTLAIREELEGAVKSIDISKLHYELYMGIYAVFYTDKTNLKTFVSIHDLWLI